MSVMDSIAERYEAQIAALTKENNSLLVTIDISAQQRTDENLATEERIQAITAERDALKAELETERGKTADACLKNGELAHELAKYKSGERDTAVEVGAFKALLLEWMPVMRAHTGASHLTDGFRPMPNKWDDLMMRTQDALDK